MVPQDDGARRFGRICRPKHISLWELTPGGTRIRVPAWSPSRRARLPHTRHRDPTCTPTVYHTGESFTDVGCGDVHLLRNEGPVCAVTIAVQIIPAGQPRRIDVAQHQLIAQRLLVLHLHLRLVLNNCPSENHSTLDRSCKSSQRIFFVRSRWDEISEELRLKFGVCQCGRTP